jgi:hypothetical protein
METMSADLESVHQIVERLHGEPPRELQLDIKPMRGGLEALSVLQVRAKFLNARGRRRTSTMVIKRLDGALAREASVYQHLVAEHAWGIAPQLLAVDHQRDSRSLLYLEWVQRISTWPWRDPATAEELVRRLARFHLTTSTANIATLLPSWDYESELKRSSETTLDLLARCRRDADLEPLSAHLSSARRLTLALPALRRELLAFAPFGHVAIHGDVHPGNVLVRRRAGRAEPILIDWGRARGGSPLEDLSGWLQSLGYWEPQARRRHDTLLGAYLSARGMERRLSSDLRAAYWLAGASNALSGALEYHLTRLMAEPPAAARRRAAAQSARDWLRVIRRAAACWR